MDFLAASLTGTIALGDLSFIGLAVTARHTTPASHKEGVVVLCDVHTTQYFVRTDRVRSLFCGPSDWLREGSVIPMLSTGGFRCAARRLRRLCSTPQRVLYHVAAPLVDGVSGARRLEGVESYVKLQSVDFSSIRICQRLRMLRYALHLLPGLLLAACLLHPEPGQAAERPVAMPQETVTSRPLPFERPSTTILGQPYAYPKGTPALSLFTVQLQPGATTSPHKHPIPLIAYVLSGSIEVDYGSKGKRILSAGQGYVEAIDWCKVGRALGPQPATVLWFYLDEAHRQSPQITRCQRLD